MLLFIVEKLCYLIEKPHYLDPDRRRSGARLLSKLDQVAAGIFEHCDRHGTHRLRSACELDAKRHKPIVLSLNVISAEHRERDTRRKELLLVVAGRSEAERLEQDLNAIPGV